MYLMMGSFFLSCLGAGAEIYQAFHPEHSAPVLNFADQRPEGINIGREVLTVEGGKGFYMADDVVKSGPPSGELATHAVAEIFHIHMVPFRLTGFIKMFEGTSS
jgi:hypothetical protein